jgi:hypothetical protein
MKISELRIYKEEDYLGEFNLAKSERDLVCKALVLKKGSSKQAASLLHTNEKKVYRAIFQHGLQDFVGKIRSGRNINLNDIEKIISKSRIKTITQ